MRIYSAPVLAPVANVKHLLEMHGIECRIEGEHRSGVGAVIGYVAPVECEEQYYRSQKAPAMVAGVT